MIDYHWKDDNLDYAFVLTDPVPLKGVSLGGKVESKGCVKWGVGTLVFSMLLTSALMYADSARKRAWSRMGNPLSEILDLPLNWASLKV
jgi:hypothetical protein